MSNKHPRATDHYVPEIRQWFSDDVRFTYARAQYKEHGLHKGHSESDVVHLHFGIKGDYRVNYKQIAKSFDLLGGHHNMFYSKEFDMEFFNKTLGIETFGIQFPKNMFIQFAQNATDELKRFSEKILNGENVMFAENWAPVNMAIEQVIQQIIQSRYSEGLQKIFLLSKSMELIVLSTEAFLLSKSKPQVFIKNVSDKEKIIGARDIINSHLKTPPNLSQLAKMTCLNEYKLKHGFKEIFKTTVFDYLTEQRLNLALQYLQDSRQTVAEIAYEMGYSTPQHFNNAFRKKFGFTPNSVRKNP